MAKLNYTNVDFNTLKDSLKDFLRSQSQFNDYDFAGSGLNVLIDELAYNSALNAFYANMVANEMFLDSAILRESVVSRAKQIGYTPRSVISAKTFLTLQFFPTGSPSSILIPKGQEFSTTIDGKSYIFNTGKAYTCHPDGSGNYIIRDVEIFEGVPLTHKFTVDFSLPEKQRFIIPNLGVDISHISVQVQASSTDTSVVIFTLNEDLNEVSNISTVYFLQEVEAGKYELIFGDGVVGKALEDGNIVIINYFVSSGPDANKAALFSQVTTIGGFTGTIITVQESAFGGTEIEDIESIRKLAPLSYEAQNRAVTKSDYETLIKKDYPRIEFVRVWGGEDNDPPQYGKVFASVKPVEGTTLSLSEKDSIVNDIIRKRNLVSIEVVLVDPDFIRIVPSVEVFYKGKLTTLTEAELQNEVLLAIQNFRLNDLNGFDASFRTSRLNAAISAVDPAITSNTLNVDLKYRIAPPLNISTLIDINFNSVLSRGDSANNIASLSSTAFTYKGLSSFLGDDGKGNIYIYRIFNAAKVIFERGVGTIDYDTGKVQIPKFKIEGIPSSNFVDIFVNPVIGDTTPIRNQILLMEDEDITILMNNEDL